MRRLAREAVIFCLITALVAGVVGLVRERSEIMEMKATLDPHSTLGDLAGGLRPLWGASVPEDTRDVAQRTLLHALANDDTKTAAWDAFYSAKDRHDLSRNWKPSICRRKPRNACSMKRRTFRD
jgi:hypothetical protein